MWQKGKTRTESEAKALLKKYSKLVSSAVASGEYNASPTILNYAKQLSQLKTDGVFENANLMPDEVCALDGAVFLAHV